MIDDLSDDELLSRLLNRNVPEDLAAELIEDREDEDTKLQIGYLLQERRADG